MSAHLPGTHYMAVAATSNSCRLVCSYVMLSCNICHASVGLGMHPFYWRLLIIGDYRQSEAAVCYQGDVEYWLSQSAQPAACRVNATCAFLSASLVQCDSLLILLAACLGGGGGGYGQQGMGGGGYGGGGGYSQPGMGGNMGGGGYGQQGGGNPMMNQGMQGGYGGGGQQGGYGEQPGMGEGHHHHHHHGQQQGGGGGYGGGY